MADRWLTFPIEFKGGLVSNLSPLQLGINMPGSARILKNFEPSVEGGYRRISGYGKYSNTILPTMGYAVVQGGSQTGTTLNLANVSSIPVAGDTFTIAGVTGTYTIAAGGVVYNATTKRATLTLTTSLASSPADRAAITYITSRGLVSGVATWRGKVLAVRNNVTYVSAGGVWSRVDVPSYGPALVQGGSQTGSSLVVDGLTGTPRVGDTFTIAGVPLVYTVATTATVVGGVATLSITPALASSPANDAALTFLSGSRASTEKRRYEKYRIGTAEKIVEVDGVNYPAIYDGANYTVLNDAPSDILGAEHVVFFKNQLFFAKGSILTFTSPFTDSDFKAANGAGVISMGTGITGLVVFREQLIIFSEQKISRLIGNTVNDFQLQPITLNIGCVDKDTIQEIGSDIMFLGPDGLRLLSATDRTGDFDLAVVSKPIQNEMTTFISLSTSFSSLVIRKKSQYRIFGYNSNVTDDAALGVLGTQLSGEETGVIAWGELRGINSYVADSDYFGKEETSVFGNASGYVYKLESGNSLDGDNIIASFSTPFLPISDPRIRKTFYKADLYVDPQGSVTTELNLRLDFDDTAVVQPSTIPLTNVTNSSASIYGNQAAIYGTSTYGAKLRNVFRTQVVGSGFTASFQFVSDSQDPPFSFDALTIEYSTHDRR